MTMWKIFQLLAAILLIGAGCGGEKAGSTNPVAPASRNPAPTAIAATNNAGYRIPTEAQPKLVTLKLWVGPEELITEIARGEREIATGMMHRKSMEENEAMLFVFRYPHQLSFWMKNTFVPLSCAYIDPEGKILEIYDMKPLDESPIPSISSNVQYVLEVKQGWFERHNIKPGVVIRTERGSFRETFFVQR